MTKVIWTILVGLNKIINEVLFFISNFVHEHDIKKED